MSQHVYCLEEIVLFSQIDWIVDSNACTNEKSDALTFVFFFSLKLSEPNAGVALTCCYSATLAAQNLTSSSSSSLDIKDRFLFWCETSFILLMKCVCQILGCDFLLCLLVAHIETYVPNKTALSRNTTGFFLYYSTGM